MVQITVELLRKRSEHNDCEISTLEEISLHQEGIEKIELINRLCKDLRILLLQNNLISKIENLGRLKLLEYLNLALNNIEVIENLEGLESLKKLDLTVNFIGDLRDVSRLQANEHLQELFLTGNPCTDYDGYRDYVVAALPQLRELDGQEILRSDRIKSLQSYAEAEGDVIRGYWNYQKNKKIRSKQLDRHREKSETVTITELTDGESDDDNDDDDEEKTRAFWNSSSYNTPEDRRAIAEKVRKIEEKKSKSRERGEKRKSKCIPKFFSPEGKPYNINQARVPFRLNDEDDPDAVTLEIRAYRHLDTSHLHVDVQPTYVRVTIKGKVLQLSLPCEVLTDASYAKRNTITGNLLITMPRMTPTGLVRRNQSDLKKPIVKATPVITKRELLEIGPPRDDLDFSNIYRTTRTSSGKKAPDDFADDAEVPPLE